jgi:metal-sulfur cluster biosynthetic enzyme
LLESNDIKIKMSLTAPGCPVAGEMPGQVADTIAKIPEVGLIEVELVWEPAWTKDRMSEDAKMALDIY